ncbi:MAG: P27 family phage terminase small subunit [Chloroflexota bacterium]|nr:P27 family phage terminase small subunit [Chloroflexota bacterium]
MARQAKTSTEQWLEGGRKPKQTEAMQGLAEMPPSPPRIQGRARAIWRETGKMLIAAGMLARADLGLLERYAGLRAGHESVTAQMDAMALDFEDPAQTAMRAYALKTSSELRQIEESLGLNPVARARMGKHQPAPKKDPLSELNKKREQMKAAA